GQLTVEGGQLVRVRAVENHRGQPGDGLHEQSLPNSPAGAQAPPYMLAAPRTVRSERFWSRTTSAVAPQVDGQVGGVQPAGVHQPPQVVPRLVAELHVVVVDL